MVFPAYAAARSSITRLCQEVNIDKLFEGCLLGHSNCCFIPGTIWPQPDVMGSRVGQQTLQWQLTKVQPEAQGNGMCRHTDKMGNLITHFLMQGEASQMHAR